MMMEAAIARIAELEAERDALADKAARLDKLVELGVVSIGIACEDRDKLKHSDRALRLENTALRQAQKDVPHFRCVWCSQQFKCRRDESLCSCNEHLRAHILTDHPPDQAENTALRQALDTALAVIDDIAKPGSLTPWVNDICREKAIDIRAALSHIPEAG